jgi:hypothetical protein
VSFTAQANRGVSAYSPLAPRLVAGRAAPPGQSWLDPFIILTALPGAVAGILWMLYGTQTTITVPALMGAIMCVGVATSNGILMVTFANDQRREGHDARSDWPRPLLDTLGHPALPPG